MAGETSSSGADLRGKVFGTTGTFARFTTSCPTNPSCHNAGMLGELLFVAYSTPHGAARLEKERIVGGDLVVRVGGVKHPRLHGAQHQSR